jgi:hypothetical protein
MRKINFTLTFINLLILSFLSFRIGVPFFNSTESIFSNTDSIGLFLSAQSTQFAWLQTIIAVFGIGLTIIGVWGYVEIRKFAEKKTTEMINTIAPQLFTEMIEKFGREELQRMLVEIKMAQTVQEKTSGVFQEGIERLLKDPTEMERPNE